MSGQPLVLASDLHGRPVVAVDSGDDIAEIKDIVYNPTTHELIGFTLNKRGWFRGSLKASLPADEIRAIGPDAVMVDKNTRLIDRSDAPVELTPDADPIVVTDTSVLSASGALLGEIRDVVVDTSGSPQAVGYELDGDNGRVFVPISAQLALSEENLILPAAATDFVRADLAGFGAAVAEYRRDLDDASEEPS